MMLALQDIYIDSCTEDLTDLNNIPTPCPYLLIISFIISNGVAERWVNLRFMLFKYNY
jgi:hypothetical protein